VAILKTCPGPGFMGDYSDGVDGMTPTGNWDYVRKHKYVETEWIDAQQLGDTD
jgi:hypothetical protein